MRILFAGLTSPYPPTNGHRLRTWSLVRAMAEDGHVLTVVSLAESRDPLGDLGPLERLCPVVENVAAPRRVTHGREGVKRLRALASALPYGAWKFRAPEFTAVLQRHLTRGTFDLVVCDGVYNVQNLPRDLRVPVLLNKDDVAHVIMQRHLAVQGTLAARAYGTLEVRKVRRWERWACTRVTAVLACSDHDRAILQALAPRARVYVAPNVVDTSHYVPMGRPEPRTVVFQGGMEWHPNRDAVEFFASAVLPALRRLVPDVVFRVAGRCSDEFRRRWEPRGVSFTGWVPEMRDEIARAAVCVVPLRVGSGTRLKILEAGAMTKAIVSTTLGAEGLAFVNGEEICLADEPNAFARAVADLLGDDARRLSLGRAARLRVEKDYSMPALQASLREVLAAVRT
jgi:glycosyltransferase involved in cell wall biosynthesis